MAGEKLFIGPKLRELRKGRGLTQAELAGMLNVSASYVNLIERNQRSASLKFLISLSDGFGLNWRDLTNEDSGLVLSDLREITKDAAFGENMPDLDELRSALEQSPNLVKGFVNIFNAYRSYGERLAAQTEALAGADDSSLGVEHSVHDFFRGSNNYFGALELEAEKFSKLTLEDRGETYTALRSHLSKNCGIEVIQTRDELLGSSLRYLDRQNKQLLLSDALDHYNKVFQLAHMIALIEYPDLLTEQLPKKLLENEHAASRCRIELANYFAAALLMPYAEFLQEAVNCKYDIERIAARFSVSYEQVCHRLTTMQRPGSRGIPFFFLRVDRGGNVSKRFNVTPIQLARFGGACPKLDVHYCFRVPGRILSQVVEMPDHSQYLTVNRTVDRAAIRFSTEDNRLALSLGCPIEYAPELIYWNKSDSLSARSATEIGVNCRLCPRHNCAQRSHDPFHSTLELDEDRRGATHFES